MCCVFLGIFGGGIINAMEFALLFDNARLSNACASSRRNPRVATIVHLPQ
jgi:hypothetical protein